MYNSHKIPLRNNNFYKGGRGLAFFKHLFRLFKSRNNRSRTLFSIAIPICFMLFNLSEAQAQSPDNREAAEGQVRTLVGEVLSRNNAAPLDNVSIRTKSGTHIGSTDNQGRFEYTIPDGIKVLVFSRIGYKSLEYNINRNERSRIRISLDTLENILDEAVVIGYGSTTRRMSTGSVTKVSAKEIERQPVSNPMLALQGLVPGLEVSPSSGISGASVNLKIRGTGSLAQGTEPLVVLNGNPIAVNGQGISQLANATGSNGVSLFNGINPADIESIEVLKDADATAIYGSRGANGVILITTKRNSTREIKIDLNSKLGTAIPSNPMPMLSTSEYVMMRKEAFANSGVPITEQNAPDLLLMDTTINTDFRKFLNGSGHRTQDINLGVSGGSERTFFRLNGNYQHESSQVMKDRGTKRLVLSSNLNHQSLDGRFSVDFTANFSENTSDLPAYDPSRFYSLPPHLELRKADGSLNWTVGNTIFRMLGLDNPLAQFEKSYDASFNNLMANLSLGYRIFEDWQIKVSSGYTNGTNKEKLRYPSTSIDPGTAELPSAQQAMNNSLSWIVEPQLLYNKSFGKHYINGLLGSSIQQNQASGSALYGTNYADDNLLGDITAAGNIRITTSESWYKYAAMFGRIGYNYDTKYLFNFSMRRDGSSRFGPGRQFATFFSVAGAWLFAEEPFVKALAPGLSYGKLRGSIGTTGNDRIGNYMFMDTWSSVGINYGGVAALQPTRLYNPDYSWEKNKKMEIALELGAWKDRVIIGASFYRTRSDNQLIAYRLPYITGFNNVNQNWDAEIENKGWEFSLDGTILQLPHFSWDIKANLAIPKNTLLNFPNLESSSYANQYVVGKSLSTRRFYRYTGIDTETGIYTFDDVNNDGVFNNDDKTTWRDLDPKFYGGLSNSFRYKNWTMGFLFDFRKQDGLSYLASLSSPIGYGLVNHPAAVLDRWQQAGDEAEFQRYLAVFEDPAYAKGQLLIGSDAIVVDASFIKLRNCYLSYHWIPNQRTRIKQIDLFVTAQNLLSFSEYQGEPEIQSPIITSPMRNISLGVKINL